MGITKGIIDESLVLDNQQEQERREAEENAAITADLGFGANPSPLSSNRQP
jgi:hypothetical protein